MENESTEIAEILRSRVPEAVSGIQVNFCKNPKCLNFGKPASTSPQPKGRTASDNPERDGYKLTGDKVESALMCRSCGRYTTVKSNKAIKEEYDRITSYLAPNLDEEPSCPSKECPNHTIGVSAGKKHYQSFGKTKAGSSRYRCKSCSKTFSVRKSTINRQSKSHKNLEVFRLVMNKVGFRRMSAITGLGMWTIYNKIDFIHKQCMAYAATKERKLFNGDIHFERLYIAVDCQVYIVNWSHTLDSNVSMPAVCSADNESGYVFGMHLNYDPAADREQIEHEALLCGDSTKPIAHRRFARLWMPGDYEVAAIRKIKDSKAALKESPTLLDEVAASYDDTKEKAEIEAFDAPAKVKNPRKLGMQVHSEYTAYAHFLMLEKLCRQTDKVRLFIDQEPAFLGASMSAFVDKIMGSDCDVFYVRIKSIMTIHEKRLAVAETRKALNQLVDKFPHHNENMLKHELIKEKMDNLVTLGNAKDKWLIHPVATIEEAEKTVCFLTDDGQYDKDHIARLYAKASLQGIDKVFNQVRNFISVLSRQKPGKANKTRQYFKESAYNPERVIKLLEIFRVYHNFHLVGKDKQTPAMRLGLTKAQTKLEDILYYKP